MITVVQHCLIKGRVTFDHHEPKMPENRYNNTNQLTEKRHPLVVIRLKKKNSIQIVKTKINKKVWKT